MPETYNDLNGCAEALFGSKSHIILEAVKMSFAPEAEPLQIKNSMESVYKALVSLSPAAVTLMVHYCSLIKEDRKQERAIADDLEEIIDKVEKEAKQLSGLNHATLEFRGFDISDAIMKMLIANGITSLEKLIEKTPNELVCIEQIGNGSLWKIKDALRRLGLELRENDPVVGASKFTERIKRRNRAMLRHYFNGDSIKNLSGIFDLHQETIKNAIFKACKSINSIAAKEIASIHGYSINNSFLEDLRTNKHLFIIPKEED